MGEVVFLKKPRPPLSIPLPLVRLFNAKAKVAENETRKRILDMKYLCLLYGNQEKVSRLSKDEFAALVEKCKVHDAELHRTGAVRMVESLEWDVTTVFPKDGKPTVTDGPFVETRDVVGSVLVIEAGDLNEAIRIASLHPAANMGEGLGWGIEIRPIAEGCHQ